MFYCVVRKVSMEFKMKKMKKVPFNFFEVGVRRIVL